jgi:hypothetical protein
MLGIIPGIALTDVQRLRARIDREVGNLRQQ